MLENALYLPRQLSNSSLRAISLHENVANIILRSLEQKHSHESRVTKRLPVATSRLDKIIGSRVTIHNGGIESPKWKSDGLFVTFSSIRQPQSNRQAYSRSSDRFLYSVVGTQFAVCRSCKVADKTNAPHRQIYSFSHTARFRVFFVVKI